jgi:hypothetical protein
METNQNIKMKVVDKFMIKVMIILIFKNHKNTI